MCVSYKRNHIRNSSRLNISLSMRHKLTRAKIQSAVADIFQFLCCVVTVWIVLLQ